MGTARAVLITMGARESHEAMLEQIAKSLETEGLYVEKLRATGFPQAKHDEMVELQGKLGNLLAKRTDTTQGSKDDTRNQVAAVANLKDHFNKLHTLMPIIERDYKPGVDVNCFKPKGRLGNSAKGLITHGKNTKEILTNLNDFFVSYFEGASPIEEHNRLLKLAEDANAQQETSAEASPPLTAEINATKGRLLELLDDLNRVGRVAYMNNAEIAARFNKDILLRARRKGSKKKAAAETPAEPFTL